MNVAFIVIGAYPTLYSRSSIGMAVTIIDTKLMINLAQPVIVMGLKFNLFL